MTTGQPRDADHRAAVLGTMLDIWMSGILVMVGTGLLTLADRPARDLLVRAGFGLVVILLLLGCKLLLRRGWAALAARCTLIVIGASVTLFVARFTGTVRAPAASAFILIVVMAGLLFSGEGLAITVVICATVVGALVAAEHQQVLPAGQGSIGVAQWMTFTVIMSLAAIVVRQSELARVRAIGTAHAEVAHRRSAEDSMSRANDSLEARIADRTAELRASEARFRALTELSADWYWEQDEHMRFVRKGGPLHEFGGIDLELVAGTCIWELPDTELQGGSWSAHQATLAARQEFRDLLIRRIMANGQVHYFTMSGTPMFDSHGVFIGYQGVAKDVSQIQITSIALTERGRELSLVLDSVPAMIAYADLEGRLRYHNLAFGQYYAAPTQGLVGQDLRQILDASAYQALMARVPQLLAGERVAYEHSSAHPLDAHSTLAVQLTPHAAASGRLLGIYAFLVDVSALRQLDRVKGEFVSIVSHELRTPLTSVKGALDLLAGPLAHRLPDQALAVSKLALSACARLARMIDDLLDLEKIDSGCLSLSPTRLDWAMVAAQAVELNGLYADQHGVRIVLHPPAQRLNIFGDADRLQQVFANLISNAVKHSRPGQAVEIAVQLADSRIRTVVRDHGSGVPEQFRARLFERFAQAADVTDRAHGGSGLGLAISRGLVERHGGRIGYEAPPDGGALFWFELDAHA